MQYVYIERILQQAQQRPFVPRIFSVDVKHVFPSHDNYRFLLVTVCAHTRCVIAIPLKHEDSVSEALLQRVLFTFGPPKSIYMDMS